ncbi:VOC family protein [Caldalkalibacillus salinus]|uniref:VOC family protein n=1 Tax=Caldalkalibacillus salinus TaxID=2803787 RepID=UPI0019241978|nr:VOC family protein [Caldalkalibacillus salinus]
MIAHIILNVKDFKESKEFYDFLLGHLGFFNDWEDDDGEVAVKSYRKNEHNIWIRCNKASVHKDFVRDIGLDHIAFLADSKAEIDKIYEMLRMNNIEVTRTPQSYPEYTKNYYAFYFRDPNGIPLEVCVM